MTPEIPDEVNRWKAKRRQALILQLVRGEMTAAGAARRGQGYAAITTLMAEGSQRMWWEAGP